LGAGAAQSNQGAGAVAIGQTAGQTNQAVSGVAVGLQAGQFGQKGGAVALGAQAGQSNQGTASIAIGLFAGQTNQPDNSIVLNASGAALATLTQTNALYVAPIRTVTGSGSVWYSNNVIAAGVQYSDYLFWNPTLGKWDVGTSDVHLGRLAGQTAQQSGAVALGLQAGQMNQFSDAVAIGDTAGQTFQGEASVAIGRGAGAATQAGDGLITLAYVSSVARASNVATIVTTDIHNLLVNQIVSIQVTTNTSFNATNVTLTGVTATSFTYNNTGSVLSTTADTGSVYASGSNAVAIGTSAGNNLQGPNSIAIGHQAGSQFQSGWTTLSGSISTVARSTNLATLVTAAAHRLVTGQTVRVVCTSNATFNVYNVAVTVVNSTTFTYANSGVNVTTVAGTGSVFVRGLNSIALGTFAGNTNQAGNAVAIGTNAGQTDQGANSVAIGFNAGNFTQGENSVAVGRLAGATGQGIQSVAIGVSAAQATQGVNAVAIGWQAGSLSQGNYGVAIGGGAGLDRQGVASIAIGFGAGRTLQHNNSIVLSALESPLLNTATSSAFYVAPVRNGVDNLGGSSSTAGFQTTYSNLTREFVRPWSVRSYTTQRTIGTPLDNGTTYATLVFNEGTRNFLARIWLDIVTPTPNNSDGSTACFFFNWRNTNNSGATSSGNSRIFSSATISRITEISISAVNYAVYGAGSNRVQITFNYDLNSFSPLTAVTHHAWIELCTWGAFGGDAYPYRLLDFNGWAEFQDIGYTSTPFPA
jgi:hypothetical protein